MKSYKSRGPKHRTMEGLDVVIWIIFGIPMLLLSLLGRKKDNG